jgi:hypothetical protein
MRRFHLPQLAHDGDRQPRDQTGRDLQRPLEIARRLEARSVTSQDPVPLHLELKARRPQQELHRLLMKHVERPAAVGALHPELAVELRQLEVDVLHAEQADELVAQVLGADRQRLQRELGFDDECREVVMLRPPATLGVRVLGLVVVVERADEVVADPAGTDVLRVAVASLPEAVEGVARLHLRVAGARKGQPVRDRPGRDRLPASLRDLV